MQSKLAGNTKEMARTKEDLPNLKYNCLADILEKRGTSVAWLSRKAGVSKTMLHRICRQESQPTLPKLFQLADALEVDPCKLLGDGSELKG